MTTEQQLIAAIRGYGYTQTDIAKALQVNQATISRASTGKFSFQDKTQIPKLERLLAHAKDHPKQTTSDLILPSVKPSHDKSMQYVPVYIGDRTPVFESVTDVYQLSPENRTVYEIQHGMYRKEFDRQLNTYKVIPYSETAQHNRGLKKYDHPIYEHKSIEEYCRDKLSSYPQHVRSIIEIEIRKRHEDRQRLLSRSLTNSEAWLLIKEVLDAGEFNSTLTRDGYNPVIKNNRSTGDGKAV